MASRNETTREIYPGFSGCAVSNFLFQRQFYQPDESQQLLPHQQHVEAVVFSRPTFFHKTPLVVASEHEIQEPTLTAGKEQEEEFSDSPDDENTNEEEENSTKQTNKSPEDELDIELFVDLIRQFSVIWNTRLNAFKDYNNKKVTLNNISTSLWSINMQVSLCHCCGNAA